MSANIESPQLNKMLALENLQKRFMSIEEAINNGKSIEDVLTIYYPFEEAKNENLRNLDPLVRLRYYMTVETDSMIRLVGEKIKINKNSTEEEKELRAYNNTSRKYNSKKEKKKKIDETQIAALIGLIELAAKRVPILFAITTLIHAVKKPEIKEVETETKDAVEGILNTEEEKK